MQADFVLYNGRIWTADLDQPWAQAVAVKGNTLVAVGTDQDMPPATRTINLGQRLMLPGLWDAHIHFYYWSLGLSQARLAGCASLEAMLETISAHGLKRTDVSWLRGWGWNETLWENPLEPTRFDLDRVTGERPALFWRSDMHTAVANTRALEAAGLLGEVPEVDGGVIEVDHGGQPTGILRELAINLVSDLMPAPTTPQARAALQEGTEVLHRYGITALCDQRMKDQQDGPLAWAALSRMNWEGQLKLRVSCNVAAHNLPHVEALGLGSGMGDEKLRIGHLKIFTDGTLGSRTAWMLRPFLDCEDEGLVLTPPEQIAEEIRRAQQVGFAVSIHAIGDRANRVCLDLFEQARNAGEDPPMPHRIEHVQLLDQDDIARLAYLNLCASVQPAHILDDMDAADVALGERADLAYRFADLARMGTLMAFGSDAPVSNVNPFFGLHGALFRQRPERMEIGPWYEGQKMTLDQALYAYTLGAARAVAWDRITGSLEVGKRADVCVLDRDLFDLVQGKVESNEVSDTRVLLTMFDGEIVHLDPSSGL